MAISLHHPPTSSRAAPLWLIGQILGLVVTIALIVGFIVRPDVALPALWNMIIPILPATFLVAPSLWRGVCPLASLNMLPNSRMGRRAIPKRALTTINAFGIVLLVLLVPARRFLFNEHGIALAVVVIAVAVAALALGTIFDAKAGFCNSICPVLPVEKLYGQHPFLGLGNPHCALCLLCTPKGCVDLAPKKAALQALGQSQKSSAWLTTAFGIFAAAFPGFIVGYFTTTDGPLSIAPAVYLNVALWSGGSYVAVTLITRLLKLPAEIILPFLAAASVSLYYWFAAPTVAATIGIAPSGTVVIQILAFTLVGVWLWRAIRRVRPPSSRMTVASRPTSIHRMEVRFSPSHAPHTT